MTSFLRIHKNLVISHGNVIGCPNWKFADVYVRTNKGYMNSDYHTLMTIEGQLYGKLDTKSIPKSVNALPVGDARSKAVSKWYKDMENCAKKLVKKYGIEA